MAVALPTLTLTSCSDDDNDNLIIDPAWVTDGVYVINSGNYGYGNSSVSFINTNDNTVTNNMFREVNGVGPGDVAQSMTIAYGKGWIVVNNSSVIFAVDPTTCRELGRIDSGLTSPRTITFVSDTKAYVSQMYDNRIAIVNPQTYKVTGYITIPDMEAATGSTEQIIVDGRYAYCNCWSYQRSIVKIDTTDNTVVAKTDVGIQPRSMAFDCYGNLRVLVDGGSWEGNPLGYEAPELVTLDPETMTVTARVEMTLGESVSNLLTSRDGKTLYWLSGTNVMTMPADNSAALAIYITGQGWLNAMTIDPQNDDLLLADALDYMQAGVIYRYEGTRLKNSYYVGIIPNSFCWLGH